MYPNQGAEILPFLNKRFSMLPQYQKRRNPFPLDEETIEDGIDKLEKYNICVGDNLEYLLDNDWMSTLEVSQNFQTKIIAFLTGKQ